MGYKRDAQFWWTSKVCTVPWTFNLKWYLKFYLVKHFLSITIIRCNNNKLCTYVSFFSSSTDDETSYETSDESSEGEESTSGTNRYFSGVYFPALMLESSSNELRHISIVWNKIRQNKGSQQNFPEFCNIEKNCCKTEKFTTINLEKCHRWLFITKV